MSEIGVQQVHELGKDLINTKTNINHIYSSDLERARESARILAGYLECPITFTSEFREVNNGDLAGMKNEIADEKYPNLYWAVLDYSECYPNGESPEMFFKRIETAWTNFKKDIVEKSENVMLMTHGGVMEVILCIENGITFSNKRRYFSTPNARAIVVEIK